MSINVLVYKCGQYKLPSTIALEMEQIPLVNTPSWTGTLVLNKWQLLGEKGGRHRQKEERRKGRHERR